MSLIIAYLVSFAVFNLGGFDSTDILLGVVFVAVYLISCHVLHVELHVSEIFDRGVSTAAHVMSAIWTLLYCLYASDRLGGRMENGLFVAVYTVCTVAGVYFAVFCVLRLILEYVYDRCADADASYEVHRFSVRQFFIMAGIIFALLLPMFLMNYPGTMTVDSFDQLNQVRGIYPYSDLHPWAHTLLIELFWNIGYAATGSVLAGVAVYMIVQMAVMSFAMSYVVESLYEAGLPRTGCILVLLGYLIYPYNIAYAITMWKDVIFSAGVIVFTVTLYRVARAKAWGVRDTVLFAVSGIVVCLIRHNGFYAFIAAMVVFIMVFRQKTAVILSLAIVIFTCAFNGPIERACHVERTEFAHNLAIPLQQIARVVKYNGDISAHDYQMLERINTTVFLRNHYEPGGADPSMQWVIFGDMAYLEDHKAEYLGLWIRLGLRNPRAYAEAFVDQTRGYYTTMPPEQTEYYGILPNEDGLVNEPLIAHTKRVKINEIMGKLHTVLPVYGILYSPGACLQLLALGVAAVLMGRRKGRPVNALIAYIPVTALIFTVIIATPLCADLRYAYPLVMCMPSLAAVTFLELFGGRFS